jgi:DNA-directed RNA polymerase specialized sigma24 family protein
MGSSLFERARSSFETTQWTRVIEPGRGGAREALAELCRAYWQPTYGLIRARGFPPAEAEDLTQGLFASLLAPGALARVDARHGRFRDWLRSAAVHFLCNELKRRRALKRGGDRPCMSIDVDGAEETLRSSGEEAPTPDRIFDRQWALTVTARALARVREDFVKEGKGAAFLRLERLLTGEDSETTDAELSLALGRTPNDLRVERHRLKKKVEERYRDYLREEIGDTVAGPHAVDDEIRLLLDALA